MSVKRTARVAQGQESVERAKGDPVFENRKVSVPAPPLGPQRSRWLRIISCVAGVGAAGVGLIYVLTGNARAIDIVLLAGGLLVALAGLILPRGRNPGT